MRGRGGIPAMHYKANEYTAFKISTSIHQSTKQLQIMSPSILITGASGYLGGTLLSHLSHTPLPPQSTLYALVRSDSQASRVQAYGCTPLFLDLDDEAAVVKAITDANISIIFFLIDALHSGLQLPLIKALGEIRRKNGGNVHFLHTSGAKIFSGHAGMPVDRDVNDTDGGLYDMQKEANAPHEIMKTVCYMLELRIPASEMCVLVVRLTFWQAVATNTTIIDTCEYYGVRSYIFIPCIVYGEGEGFGNRISIQTAAVVRAAKALGAVYDVNPEGAVRIFPSRYSYFLLIARNSRGQCVMYAIIRQCM
jgi:hypothetical protein